MGKALAAGGKAAPDLFCHGKYFIDIMLLGFIKANYKYWLFAAKIFQRHIVMRISSSDYEFVDGAAGVDKPDSSG